MQSALSFSRRYYLALTWAAVGLLLVATHFVGGPEPGTLVRLVRRTLAILWAMSWVTLPFTLRGFRVQYGREVGAYFLGPIAYVCMAVLLVFNGLIFAGAYLTEEGAPASLIGMQHTTVFLFIFTVPILTMRLLAGERGSGTFEVLMTDPITDLEVVLAKFCAAATVLVALLVPQAVYIAIIARFGRPDMSATLCGYLGLLCIGALMVSIGLFISSLVKSQTVAAIIGIVALFLVYMAAWPLEFVANLGDQTREFLREYISIPHHIDHFFGLGLLSVRLLVLYVSTTALFLFLSIRAVEARKWR